MSELKTKIGANASKITLAAPHPSDRHGFGS